MSEGKRPYARVRFAKTGLMRFVGHLDMARYVHRAVRRAGIPVAYTQGFNPKAKISFSPALQLGAESEAELCIIDLAGETDAAQIRDLLAPQLSDGLRVIDVTMGWRGRRSPIGGIVAAEYDAELLLAGVEDSQVSEAVAGVLGSDSLMTTRSGEAPETEIRPGVLALEYCPGEPPTLSMTLRLAGGPVPRPHEVVAAVNGEIGRVDAITITRLVRKSLA